MPIDNISVGDVALDLNNAGPRVNGKAVDLTALEFKLLSTLMQRRGRLQTRERLLNDVWNYDGVVATRTVDAHVGRVREKLGKCGQMIETVRGEGYRFCAD